MTGAYPPDPSPAEIESAALLLLRAHAGDRRHSEVLADWIGDDPGRRRTIERLQFAWESMDELGRHPRVKAMGEQALDLVETARARSHARRRAWAAAACAVLCLLVSSMILWNAAVPAPTRIANASTKARTVRLADGSTVALDAGSLIDVRFARGERLVSLVKGQARFIVAHDASRPFHVIANDRDVRAVGTDFNVDLNDDGIVVSLLEGKVDVARVRSPSAYLVLPLASVRVKPIRLSGGDQLVLPLHGEPRLRPFDAGEVTAWQRGLLVLDRQSLAGAVAAVNRHAVTPIRLEEVPPGLVVSGSFQVGESDSFAQDLALLYPQLSVRREAAEIVVSGLRTPPGNRPRLPREAEARRAQAG